MLTEPIIHGIPASGETGHFHRLLQEIHRRAYERFLDRQRRQIPGSEAEDWKSAERDVFEKAGMLAAPAFEPRSFDLPEPQATPFGPAEEALAEGFSEVPPAWTPDVEAAARPPLTSVELLERLSHEPAHPVPMSEVSPVLGDLEVEQVMTRNLVAVGPDCTVRQLVAVLDEHHASAIPVVDAGKRLLGIVAASDIVHLHAKAASMAAEYVRSGQVPANGADPEVMMGMLTGELLARVRAADACAPQLPSVAPRTKVLDVVAMMASRRLDRVLVVQDGKVVGMLAAPDLLRLLLGDLQPVRG